MDEGCTLAIKGILQEKQDVFYLSLEELLALEENRFSGNVQELIKTRKKKFEQY